MSDALDLIWRRAELRGHVFTAQELSRWPREEYEAILGLGLLRRASDALSLICDDCGPPHEVEVVRDPRKPKCPYYICPEIGRVSVAPADLWQWEVDFEQVAVSLKTAAFLSGKTLELVRSRIWLLGRHVTNEGDRELFLMAGISWPDGLQVLNQCARLQQSAAAVILVPSRLPPHGKAGKWPVRTLAESLSLSNSKLLIDIAALASARETRRQSKQKGYGGRPPKDQTGVIFSNWVDRGRPEVTSTVCDQIARELFAAELNGLDRGSPVHRRARERVRQAIKRSMQANLQQN